MAAPTPILAAVYRGKSDELATLLAAQPTLTLFEAAALGDAARVRAHRPRRAGGAERAQPRRLAGAPPGRALRPRRRRGRAARGAAPTCARCSDNHEANTALHAALAGRRACGSSARCSRAGRM